MSPRLNLLFIFTDQQRADSLGCYGNPLTQTPHLNRLAAEGTLFENAYVTQPVCTPSRASIMTGLYPHTHNCIDNNVALDPELPTIGDLLSADYRKAYMGKWHLGDEIIAQHGFDTWVSIEDYYREHYSRPEYTERFSSYHHFLVENGFEPELHRKGTRLFGRERVTHLPEPFTKARFLGQQAARYLRDVSHDPFVLYVNFLEPHRPYSGPLDDLYSPDALPLGPNFRQPPPENAAQINRLLSQHYMQGGEIDDEDLTTEAGSRKTRAKYLGNVTLVDRAVGDILAALDERGLSQNTLVVYTSDHGDMMGDHSIFEKCCMYEEAMKVPLIMRAPWLKGGVQRISERISHIDLVPTLLDVLGEPIPSTLPGASRADVLDGSGTLAGSDVVVEWNGSEWRPPRVFKRGLAPEAFTPVRGPWRTIFDAEGWKLNLSPVDRSELYDLTHDPYEQVNQFNDPAQQPRIAAMTQCLRTWQTRTGDDMPLEKVA